jgi:hypothetical protein
MISSIYAKSSGMTRMSRRNANTWAAATWQGARLAQLRAVRRLSVRQRLRAMEDLNALARRLATMPRDSGDHTVTQRRPRTSSRTNTRRPAR